MENIHPIEDIVLNKADKEQLIGQNGVCIWFTGLSGSGKSTLANLLERKLGSAGIICTLLDGDNIRNGINNDLDFSIDSRRENIRRIAEVNKLFNNAGIVSLSSFISPTSQMREMAANIIGKDNFILIYVSTPLEECENRDVKGLYKKARAGEIKGFTGIDSVYEAPDSPFLKINTTLSTAKGCVEEIYSKIIESIKKDNE